MRANTVCKFQPNFKKANNDMEDQIKTSKTKNVIKRIKIETKSKSEKNQKFIESESLQKKASPYFYSYIF